MKQIQLPNTDLTVSELCLGTGDFGAGTSAEESGRLLDIFVEAGGNFLDTALIYADWTPAGKGSSERTLAGWRKSRGATGVVIATKGGHPELATMHKARLSHRYIQMDVEASLRNLEQESIDVYLLHRDDAKRQVEDILSTMEQLVEAGKIRYYGFSNWTQKRAETARMAAAEGGAHGFVANQPLWSLAEADNTRLDSTLMQMDASFREWHRKHNFPLLAYSSQANGFFNKLAAGGDGAMVPGLFDTPRNRQVFAAVQNVAADTGLTVTQIVIGYLRSQPFPVIPIVGCKNETHLRDSLSAAGVQLPVDVLARLEV